MMAPNRKSDRPLEIHQPMRCGGNRERCEYDTTDGQERNRAKIVLELAPTHQEGRGVDDGWQYEEQHELWSQL